MVDLNLWRLEYGDTLLEFGTHESGHPFTTQVTVVPADLETDDLAHPLADGLVFGVDYARGMTIGFNGVHLTLEAQPWQRRWTRPMDNSGPFKAAWKADAVRKVAGSYASLTNVDRGRVTYGRPRGYVPDYDKVRAGWLPYSCGFAALEDRFYDAVEQVAVVGVDPGEAAMMTFPVTFPFTSATSTETRRWVTNAGDSASWPVVTFRRGGRPKLDLLNNAGGVTWSLEVDANLDFDEEVVVDCRPWVRTITRNGSPAPGVLRGARLEACTIPVGTHELRLSAIDPSGLADVEVRWRDAYEAL